MTLPNVQITELDGALGVLPPSAGKLYALVGVSSAGPVNQPATFARVRDVIATYGTGPLVEAAAHALERYGRPVVLVRTGQSVAGDEGTLDEEAFTGTSTVTLDTTPANGDHDVAWRAVTGGTIGTAGITFQWSLDGGRTWSPTTALGTANTFEFPGTGGVNVDFAAGTVVAADRLAFRTTAPRWDAAELAAALEALAASSVTWELVHVVGPIDADAFDVIELRIAAMHAAGKERAWIANARTPNPGETEAAYRAALETSLGGRATLFGQLCAGACKLTSSVSGRKVRVPSSFVIAAREASVSEEVNVADVNLGPLVGVTIRDLNGNPDEHDEAVHPGLDDARFTVLRTWDSLQGVYVNRPRLFSPAGSDFQLLPHRRVMNVGHEALRTYFVRRLNRPILVDQATGYIREEEALEIEAGALAVLRAALLAKPKASGVQFALSRTDNLLSTRTLTGEARIIPLAYPETITLTVGFSNPALLVQAV